MNKKTFIISASVIISIVIFGSFTFSNIQEENTDEFSEPSNIREGDFWIIHYDSPTESFPIDSLNKELRIIYGLHDHQLDPISEFDTLDKLLEYKSYLKYNDSVNENTFGLLLYYISDSQERKLIEELFREIPAVKNVQFHNVWNVRITV